MKEHFPRRHILLIAAAALLGGCATLDDYSCYVHEQQTRGQKPVTTYVLTTPPSRAGRPEARNLTPPPPNGNQPEARTLPSGSVPQVPKYTMTFKPGFTKPCTTLTLYKDVVIYRSNDPDVVLNEVREFYAEDGTLITTTTQDITPQVGTSGTYVATTPLPVPKNAPPGKYKIVSKLLFERRHERRPAIQLARAEGFFYIIPRQ
jgi:hypothetical protein